jgi:hypothetical protein
MIVFRWMSIVLVAVAVMLLGGDLVTTLEKKAVVVRSLNDVMLLFGYDARATLFESLPPLVFAVVDSLISWPGWLIMAFWGFVSAVIAPAPRAVRPLPPPPPIPR